MTTFAYTILKLIQQSRPGTHDAGSHQISFATPGGSDAYEISEAFSAYERYMRGAAKLICAPSAAPIAPCERKTRIYQMICDLYEYRWKLSRESAAVIARVQCPEPEFRRIAFRLMMGARIRTIASRAKGVRVEWNDATDTIEIKSWHAGTQKAVVVQLRNNAMLATDFNCVGGMYEGFTKAFRRTEKALVDALSSATLWTSNGLTTHECAPSNGLCAPTFPLPTRGDDTALWQRQPDTARMAWH